MHTNGRGEAPSTGRAGHALRDLVGQALGASAPRAGRGRRAAGRHRHRRAPAVERLRMRAAVEAAPAVRAARTARGGTGVGGGIGHGAIAEAGGTSPHATSIARRLDFARRPPGRTPSETHVGQPSAAARATPPESRRAIAGGPPRAMPRRAAGAPAGPKTRCCAAPLLYNSPCFNRSQPEPPPCPSPSTSRRSPPR